MTVSRRQARHDAMVILYQHEITGTAVDALFRSHAADSGYELDAYTLEVVAAVLADTESLDAAIDRYSINWPAHRIAPLERSILRIAIHEITTDEQIAAETSIDEAVTLAKRFCSREAGALINGILGQLAQERSGDGST